VTKTNFLHSKAIHADLDGDCRTDIVDIDANGNLILHAEARRINDMAKDQKADVNIYFVEELDLSAYGISALGLSLRTLLGIPIIFAVGDGDQSMVSTELLTAHELGHYLGLFHCNDNLSIDNNCGGEGGLSLMHSEAALPGFEGCRLHKPEWDCANTQVSCQTLGP
jgi:hypothetical protein